MYWEQYSTSVWQPVLFHVAAVLLAGGIVARGLAGGIERANKVLIPTLFVLLLVAVARAVTLEGAGEGLRFLFQPDLAALADYRTWLEALTQSAWSTGAGWGLVLAYAIYVRSDEDVVVSSVAIGVGNNFASLLAGMAILPTAFAILSTSEALEAMAAGNVGLTFIWVPRLFDLVPAGHIFLPIFFLALFCAALSSLIAMTEMAARVLMDGGMSRWAAVRVVAAAAVVCGIPSAVSVAVFENQDWVWGLGLMVSGLFISIAATRYGQERFRSELINVATGTIQVGRIYGWVLKYLVPAEFAVMFGWWIYQSVAVYDSAEWWNPIRTYSLGTCLLQWGYSARSAAHVQPAARDCQHALGVRGETPRRTETREGRYATVAHELEHVAHSHLPAWAQAAPRAYWQAADEGVGARPAGYSPDSAGVVNRYCRTILR